jgi:predicted nucleic acid-binding protein
MIFVDSNVFVLALRYPRDANAADNSRFLDELRSRGDGVTSVVNVLETCGVLSFNLNKRQLLSLNVHFARRFAVSVVPESGSSSVIPATVSQLLTYIGRRMSFGDALVAYSVDMWAPEAEAFVSWDARHIRGKIGVTALTPREFLQEIA